MSAGGRGQSRPLSLQSCFSSRKLQAAHIAVTYSIIIVCRMSYLAVLHAMYSLVFCTPSKTKC